MTSRWVAAGLMVMLAACGGRLQGETATPPEESSVASTTVEPSARPDDPVTPTSTTTSTTTTSTTDVVPTEVLPEETANDPTGDVDEDLIEHALSDFDALLAGIDSSLAAIDLQTTEGDLP